MSESTKSTQNIDATTKAYKNLEQHCLNEVKKSIKNYRNSISDRSLYIQTSCKKWERFNRYASNCFGDIPLETFTRQKLKLFDEDENLEKYFKQTNCWLNEIENLQKKKTTTN